MLPPSPGKVPPFPVSRPRPRPSYVALTTRAVRWCPPRSSASGTAPVSMAIVRGHDLANYLFLSPVLTTMPFLSPAGARC